MEQLKVYSTIKKPRVCSLLAQPQIFFLKEQLLASFPQKQLQVYFPLLDCTLHPNYVLYLPISFELMLLS